jgi:chromosome partitioning protein
MTVGISAPPKRITFLNQKGGVGKTTLVLLLTAVLQRAGKVVVIDDRDPQGTATFFAKSVLNLPLLSNQPAEYVITDTPGHLRIEGSVGAELIDLIGKSDRLVLVAEKSPASIHGSAPMARLIKQHKNEESKAFVLFNKVRSQTTIGRQSGPDLAARLELPHLINELPLSSAFENAFVEDLAAVSGKYLDRMLNLALEILT